MSDLPSILMQTSGGAVVEVSDEAGGFYCEHCLYAARAAADDNVVVGFLHVPPDAFPRQASQRRRHGDTREVVGAAVAGLLRTTMTVHTPLRVLLTGFRPWDKVQRNPSGDFVAHAGNIDAVIAALGGRLLGVVDGRRRADIDGRLVEVARVVLPVDDRAIDGGPLSVQAAIARQRPHVVLSMGVHREASRYRVERTATDRRLRRAAVGVLAHDEGVAVATLRLPRDERLARAIVSGSRSLASTSTSTSTSTTPSATAPAPAS